MADFTWDVTNEADRALYYWPREAVLAWWEDRWDWEREGETFVFERPQPYVDEVIRLEVEKRHFARRDTDLERQLEDKLGGWLIAFPADGPNQRLWDPFHLPLFDPTTGALSPKHPDAEDAWDQTTRDLFRQVVHERMADGAAASELCPLHGIVLPPDTDLRIDEAAREAPRPLTANLSAALIGPKFSVNGRKFSLSPENSAETAKLQVFVAAFARFAATADFRHAQFAGDADFRDAQFAADARFGDARFAADAGFGGARFAADANFRDAQFAADARFGDAQFAGDADFYHARFAGDAGFWQAHFTGHASFRDASFRDAAFGDAHFAADARFVDTKFAADAGFGGAHFAADADFRRAHFAADADFYHARFAADAGFWRAHFAADADFWGAQFAGAAGFRRAHFAADARFGGAQFTADADFIDTKFARHISFTNARFLGAALFETIIWPDKAEHWHGAFDRAVFEKLASFEGSGCQSFAAFTGATFAGGLVLDAIAEKEVAKTFRDELAGAIAAAASDAEALIEAEPELREIEAPDGKKPKRVGAAFKRRERRHALNTRLRELEAGCRVLEREMVKQLDRTREQLFYRFEIIARRKQPDTGWPEKAFSFMYGVASDYGASLLRPIISLLVIVALFGATFFAWGSVVSQEPLSVWHALDFAWSNVFRPLSALSQDAVRPSPLTDALYADAAIGFGVRFVATIQSLLALIFAFLFGLAVRRRFQMS